MANIERPLSPHLSAYRWGITSSLSILHRASGVFLSLGAVVLVLWLLALASGPEAYEHFVGKLSGAPGRVLLVLFSAAGFYHLLNGIRHLFWDAGKGFELKTAQRSGLAVVFGAAVLTGLFWLVAIGVI